MFSISITALYIKHFCTTVRAGYAFHIHSSGTRSCAFPKNLFSINAVVVTVAVAVTGLSLRRHSTSISVPDKIQDRYFGSRSLLPLAGLTLPVKSVTCTNILYVYGLIVCPQANYRLTVVFCGEPSLSHFNDRDFLNEIADSFIH